MISKSRLDLHQILVTAPDLATDPLIGGPAVYFQPPPTVQMHYPCIVYEVDREHGIHADDRPYVQRRRYSVTVIDPDPDSEIPDFVRNLESAAFERFYTEDNLNHTVYTLYF